MENLYEVKLHYFNHPNITHASLVKIGKIAVLSVDSGAWFNGKSKTETLLQMPNNSLPAELINISAVSIDGNFTNLTLGTEGKLRFKQDERPTGAFIFTVTYICA